MQPADFLPELCARGLLAPAQATLIQEHERTRLFSLHYELRTLLYVGIVLLTGGLGVLLYQHLDEIGHGVIVAAIVLLMAGSFGYATRHRLPFTWQQAPTPGLLPDYALLLGCLLFLTLEGYLQAQYTLFGTRYGLATFLPAVLFFLLAYRFDHRGVLSMAITTLASWVGLSVAPLSAFQNDFGSVQLVLAAIGLGAALILVGLASEHYRRKAHFAFTYLSLGSNLLLVATIAGLFSDLLPPFPAILLAVGVSAFLVWYARRTHSYFFLLLGLVYGYVAVTYGLFILLSSASRSMFSDLAFQFFLFYFPLSAIGIVFVFLNIKQILRINDRQGL